ncbi:MAG: hypothetical protein IPH43_10840 [Xanthomonadales bacterium]|nr:hypothetical protein [Xanthomonadales bacterium]
MAGFDQTWVIQVTDAATDLEGHAQITHGQPGRATALQDFHRKEHAEVVGVLQRPGFALAIDEDDGLLRRKLADHLAVPGMVAAGQFMRDHHGLLDRQRVEAAESREMLGHGRAAEIFPFFLDVRITCVDDQACLRMLGVDITDQVARLLGLAGVTDCIGQRLVGDDAVAQPQRLPNHVRIDWFLGIKPVAEIA